MTITHAPEPRSAIEAAGSLPDLELDIATGALQLARVDAPEADWCKVAAHFSDIARKVVQAASMDAKADAGDLEARRLILTETLHGHFGYQGDSETYEDMANANLIRVVERRRGLPVALGILWLHAADAAG
ncbi:MAG: transglutaminase family protein, partial [Acetobacteraceae bacterium]